MRQNASYFELYVSGSGAVLSFELGVIHPRRAGAMGKSDKSRAPTYSPFAGERPRLGRAGPETIPGLLAFASVRLASFHPHSPHAHELVELGELFPAMPAIQRHHVIP